MIKKVKQFNSNGKTILNAKLNFKSTTPSFVIDTRPLVRERLNYDNGYFPI